jgi:hypothetical protein
MRCVLGRQSKDAQKQMNTHHQKIRDQLKGSDGLTTKQLQYRLEVDQRTLCKALKSMPDAYIDRWTGPHRGQWAAVWCVVEVPEDCPKPDEKNMEAPLLQTQRANRAGQDDLGNGKGERVADNVGVDQRQSFGGQALSYLRESLRQRLGRAHQKLDAGDKK